MDDAAPAVALGASPSFALTATTNLAAFMALLFLALALDGFLRFVFLGQTHGGFQAGLTIGIAGLCDPTAVIFAIGFAAAAPLIARSRYRGQRHAGRATAAVLLFPTLAGIAGWIFLCWRFTGSPLGWLRTAAPGLWSDGGSFHALSTALTQSFKPVLLTPIFVLAVVLLLVARRPLQAAGICLPLVAVILAKWVGLSFSGLSIAVVVGIVGVVSLPAAPASARPGSHRRGRRPGRRGQMDLSAQPGRPRLGTRAPPSLAARTRDGRRKI